MTVEEKLAAGIRKFFDEAYAPRRILVSSVSEPDKHHGRGRAVLIEFGDLKAIVVCIEALGVKLEQVHLSAWQEHGRDYVCIHLPPEAFERFL